MRVVHLIGELGFGGSERQLFLLLKHRDRAGQECHVVVFNRATRKGYESALRDFGVTVWTVPTGARGVLARCRFLLALLHRLRPQVVHSWTVHDNPYAAVVGGLLRVPVRWGSLRGSTELRGFRGLPAPVRWLALRGVSKLVVNARVIRDQRIAEGHPPNRLEVLPNCVEVPELDGADTALDLEELGITANERVIGSIGNLRAVKNHLLWVQALALVLPRHPDVKGLIVGQPVPSEPEVAAELVGEIERLGFAGRVVVTGFRDDVPQLVSRFELLGLTSHSEGVPNSILEAMAAARPVVATRVGGVPELVRDGVSGWLVAPGDAPAMATAIDRLLGDPELARRMGCAGREIALAEHGCSELADRLHRGYRDALRAVARGDRTGQRGRG